MQTFSTDLYDLNIFSYQNLVALHITKCWTRQGKKYQLSLTGKQLYIAKIFLSLDSFRMMEDHPQLPVKQSIWKLTIQLLPLPKFLNFAFTWCIFKPIFICTQEKNTINCIPQNLKSKEPDFMKKEIQRCFPKETAILSKHYLIQHDSLFSQVTAFGFKTKKHIWENVEDSGDMFISL